MKKLLKWFLEWKAVKTVVGAFRKGNGKEENGPDNGS